jgi:hypothetical protein
MTELERTQRAIGAAMAYLRDKKDPDAVGTLEYINAVLNPPPVYEPVEEIVGWVNVYQWKDSGRLFTSCVHGDEETATLQNAPSGCERISCQPIKVTAQREKKRPVERSVAGSVGARSGYSFNITLHGDAPLTPALGSEILLTWEE